MATDNKIAFDMDNHALRANAHIHGVHALQSAETIVMRGTKRARFAINIMEVYKVYLQRITVSARL